MSLSRKPDQKLNVKLNVQKLREAESLFLHRYPGGFQSEEMQQVGRKHNVGKLAEFTREALAKKRFSMRAAVLDDIVRIVSRSSMVSMFEKPKFRDYVNGMNRDDREFLANSYRKLLHGNQQKGFEDVADVLREGKLAKWSLMTICLFSWDPQKEVFVKPTTTKNVIRQFEVDDLVYKPQPTWLFYAAYRELLAAMKAPTDPSLSPNNAAFTGFLMMTTAVGQPG